MGHHMFHHCVFRHVFHKVRLRGVRPAAHAAAVRLGVFDGVCRQVDLQRGRVRIGTVTVGTFEGLVFVVLPLVRLQIGQLSKSFFTAGMGAFIRPIACVDSGVLLQMGELAKAFLTVGAAVRFDAQVYAQVLSQVRSIRKGLSAVRTLVSLCLCVRLGVNLHV